MIDNHPDHVEERRASVSRTVTNKHSSIGKELEELLDDLLSDRLTVWVWQEATERRAANSIATSEPQSSRCGRARSRCRRTWA